MSGTRKRITVEHGTLQLQLPDLAPLVCELSAVDEEGCRGKIVAGSISLELATAWHPQLVPGQNMQVLLEARTPALSVQASATVQHLLEFLNHVEIELKFVGLSAALKSAISRARFSLALSDFDVPVTVSPPPPPPPPAPRGAVDSARLQTMMIPQAELGIPSRVEAKTKGIDSELHSQLRSKKIGEVLVHMGHLTPDQAENAAAVSAENQEPLGRLLLRTNLVTAHALCHALALQSGLPMVDLNDVSIGDELSSLFAFSTLCEYRFVPFEETSSSISIAAAGPLKQKALNDLERIRDKALRQFLCEEDLLLQLLDQIGQRRTLRRHTRFKLSLPVRYQFCNRVGRPTEETIYFVRTLNVSEGGLAVEGVPNLLATCPDVRRQDMYANLIISAPNGGVHAICQLRWIRRSERKIGSNDAPWLIGMQVVEISGEDHQKLRHICATAAKT